MDPATVRSLIEQHFAAAGNDETRASEIYASDAILDFPQSGERIRGTESITAFREAYPAVLEFQIKRIVGSGDLWVNQYTISYDGKPSHVVGIMEFADGKVVHETVYIADPWDPPAWRAQWAEPITPDAD